MRSIGILALSAMTLGGAGGAFAQGCERLQSFSHDAHAVTIESLRHVETNEDGPGGPRPAHCRVEGVADARTGVNGVLYGTRFALALPDDWNGRLLFQGGGGLNGSVGEPLGAAASGGRPALSRGFAVVATDTGHQAAGGFDASFTEDKQAALDFHFTSNAKMVPIAKAMIAAHYGQPAEYSYYAGCSTGGREGMIMSQRYPLYFDGIVSGAPAMRTGYSNMSLAYINAAFAEFAPAGPDGRAAPAGLFSDSDRRLIVDGLMAACDADDGVADGMIFNTRSCAFAPSSLTCADEKTDACLAEDQVRALEKAFRGPVDSRGVQVYPPFPWDPGLNAAGGGLPGILQSGGSSPVQAQQTSGGFDVDRAAIALEQDPFGAIGDSLSTMLSSFRDAGSRLILYHGMADPWFSAEDTRLYYERLAETNGGPEAVRDFSRLFLVPGMGHCGGGAATLDSFDMIAAIVDWVENGVEPVRVISSGAAFPDRSRPLCPYPQYAHYTGGEAERADSFECRAP